MLANLLTKHTYAQCHLEWQNSKVILLCGFYHRPYCLCFTNSKVVGRSMHDVSGAKWRACFSKSANVRAVLLRVTCCAVLVSLQDQASGPCQIRKIWLRVLQGRQQLSMHGKRRPVKIQTWLLLWVDRPVLDEHAHLGAHTHLVVIIQGVFDPLCKLHGLIVAAHIVIHHGTQHLHT